MSVSFGSHVRVFYAEGPPSSSVASITPFRMPLSSASKACVLRTLGRLASVNSLLVKNVVWLRLCARASSNMVKDLLLEHVVIKHSSEVIFHDLAKLANLSR